jgi:hypothetical protein
MPVTQVERTPLRLGSIGIASDGIGEYTREGHRTVFVPRSGVERLAVRRGFTCERPVASLVGAVLCLGGSGIVSWKTIPSLGGDHLPLRLRMLVWTLIPGAVGLMFLWTLIRHGRYLRVDTTRGSRKLLLRGTADREALRELLGRAQSQFGYEVDLSSPDEV